MESEDPESRAESIDNRPVNPISADSGQLSEYLLARQPECLFIIGKVPTALHWPDSAGKTRIEFVQTLGECSGTAAQQNTAVMHLSAAQMISDPTADQAVSGNNIRALETTLGQAVRQFPEQLVVTCDSALVPDTVFFALGFKRLKVIDTSSGDDRLRWYEYRLSDYKQPPEWLNARFWANPERFALDTDEDIDTEDDDEEE